ncbi:dihydropteroate synthase, partial [Burkholderia pseudomallei]
PGPAPLHRGSITLTHERPNQLLLRPDTPNSFSDRARYVARDAALAQADRMLAECSDILDFGGESSRPGGPHVPLNEVLE